MPLVLGRRHRAAVRGDRPFRAGRPRGVPLPLPRHPLLRPPRADALPGRTLGVRRLEAGDRLVRQAPSQLHPAADRHGRPLAARLPGRRALSRPLQTPAGRRDGLRRPVALLAAAVPRPAAPRRRGLCVRPRAPDPRRLRHDDALVFADASRVPGEGEARLPPAGRAATTGSRTDASSTFGSGSGSTPTGASRRPRSRPDTAARISCTRSDWASGPSTRTAPATSRSRPTCCAA